MTLGVVLALAVGTYAMRVAGPLLQGRFRFSERARQLMSVAAIALLGAFVVISTFTESGAFAGWARVAGVAVAGVLALRRASFVVVVLAAAVTTAGLRLVLLA